MDGQRATDDHLEDATGFYTLNTVAGFVLGIYRLKCQVNLISKSVMNS